MNEPIMLSPHDLFTMFLAICVAITTVSAAMAVLTKLIQKMRQPEKSQNERIDELERVVKRHDALFSCDSRRLNDLEEGNKVTQQALLALLSHAINGNDTDKLTKARDTLQQYLIEKGGVYNAE